MMNKNENQKYMFCRLCDGILGGFFTGKILGKYEVEYYKCSKCYSVQSENPYWLDEAYSQKKYNLDTGALQRNLNNFASCYILSKILSTNKVIDFGGKDGLLCRFLRDHSIECYVYDKYSSPEYALDFQHKPDTHNIDMVLAFEVIEHFANPKSDIDEIFRLQSNYIVVTTELYSNQGKDWWYFARETGQHIFFYTVEAINLIADNYGYGVTLVGGYILFYKKNIPEIHNKLISLNSILNGWIFQAIKSYIFLLPTPGVQTDFDFIKSKILS